MTYKASKLIQIYDPENSISAMIDRTSKTLVTIESAHAELHRGDMYTVSDGTSGLKSQVAYYIVNPSNTIAHLNYNAFCATGAKFTFSEAPSVGAGGTGTALVPVNNLRTSANSSVIKFFVSTTVANTGTLLENAVLPSGKFSGGGSAKPGVEWILNTNTTYLLQITDLSGSNTTSINIQFYEP